MTKKEQVKHAIRMRLWKRQYAARLKRGYYDDSAYELLTEEPVRSTEEERREGEG